MIMVAPPTQVNDHPLAGLSPEQRANVRAQAFGRVLAAIALHKSGSESGDAETEGGRPEVGQRLRPSASGGGHKEGEERWS